ncbi:hypothetical protein [Gabonibacter chumensis]|uniref:hypothetical protein n=1 Tax=Gabonibacter chumensis TaxID=2972474 RepID=UPI0025743FBC|nr:hypothetical protein [Gabonibacter chumensis]MCR9011213.1 hypothetical protein [Gabonibacter chumensis]
MDTKKHRPFVLHGLLLGVIYTLVFSSCLSEPDRSCPAEYQLRLSVGDKNYVNISEIPQLSPKDESLPFRAYVGNVMYCLENVATGQVFIDASSSPVEGNDGFYTLRTTDIPDGRYALSVLGSTDVTNVPEDGVFVLHANNQESFDTYFFHDTITLNQEKTTYYFSLSRVKGLLVVLLEDAPDSLARVEVNISSVQQNFDLVNGYSGESFVHKSFMRDGIQPDLFSTFVAPTVSGKKSVVRLSLFSKNETMPYAILPDIELVVMQNEIAFAKIGFTSSGVEIWIYVSRAWQKLHNMDININGLN